MPKPSFHPEAQTEYEEAIAWYRRRSEAAADGFESEVERVLGLIESSPLFFPAYDDEHRFAVLRRYPYSLVYRVDPDGLFVVAVAHSARKVGYWEGRS